MQSEDMAKIPINDPDHWRRRAEETRTVAAEISDFQVKRKMLRIAEDYEELARRAEKRLAAKKKGN
jgi:molecular chaperone GrpE (heat shock protein)